MPIPLPYRARCAAARPSTSTASSPFSSGRGVASPRPVSEEGEHGVELLLNRRTVRGVTRYLVRRRGHASSDDEWLRVEELSHCPEKVAEYDAGAPRRRTTRRAVANPPAGAAGLPSPLVAPTGFAAPAEVFKLSGPALVERAVLFSCRARPTEGWVAGPWHAAV